MIVGAISVFQEAGRVGDAVRSLLVAGCDRVFVLDGAWHDAEGQVFGGGDPLSTDGTLDEARDAGAGVGLWHGPGADAEKQTALLQLCGAGLGDFVVKIDADERIDERDRIRQPKGHSLMWLRNHGANDIPGVRSSWPRGDDADFPIPLFRCFKWSPTLVCHSPGRWTDNGRHLEPYLVGALGRFLHGISIEYKHPLSVFYRQLREAEHLAKPRDAAAFPILPVTIHHYRDARNAGAKVAHYAGVAA